MLMDISGICPVETGPQREHASRTPRRACRDPWGATGQRRRTYLHDDHGFLDDVADSCADELKQDVDATLGGLVDLDCGLADSLDTPPDEVNVYFLSVSGFQLRQQHENNTTNITRQNVTHSFSSLSSGSTLCSVAKRTMISSFSTFT